VDFGVFEEDAPCTRAIRVRAMPVLAVVVTSAMHATTGGWALEAIQMRSPTTGARDRGLGALACDAASITLKSAKADHVIDLALDRHER
jgi:hypothetical protein